MKENVISENFNITVNTDINEILESDIINFHIGTRNLLINKIVYYYLENELNDENPLKKNIKEKLSSLKIDKEEEIEEVYNLVKEILYSTSVKEKEVKKLNFRLNKDTFRKYQEYLIKIEKNNFSTTKFFREIFMWYRKKKQFEREMILYNEELKVIRDVIKNKRILLAEVRSFNEGEKTKEIKMIPLGIVTSKNENFSYVLGYSEKTDRVTRKKTGIYDIFPTRVSNILKPFKGKKYNVIKEEETIKSLQDIKESFIKKARNMIKNKIVTFGEENEIIVALTEFGKYQLETIVHNRPFELEKVKDNYDKKLDKYIYKFKNTNFAALIYFFNFGKECEILSPESLRKDIQKKYMEALEIYK